MKYLAGAIFIIFGMVIFMNRSHQMSPIAFEKLRKMKVPEEIIEQIMIIEHGYYEDAQLREKIKSVLGEEGYQKYGGTIISSTFKGKNMFVAIICMLVGLILIIRPFLIDLMEFKKRETYPYG